MPITKAPVVLEAPSPVPLSSTLLDHATITEGLAWLDPAGLYESFNCLTTDRTAVFPCPKVELDAPVQAASSTNTSGGTLAAGTYRARITAVNQYGETVGSNEISQVTTGSTSRIVWNWAAVTNANSYRVYVTAVGGATNTEAFLVETTALTYNWLGTPARDADRPLPLVNTAYVGSAAKTFDEHTVVDGIRFAVYGGLECKGFGISDREQQNLERVFALRESIGVERAFMDALFNDATDLTPTPGTGVTPEVAIALMERAAAKGYAGVPVIHVSRSIASLLFSSQTLVEQGGLYYTRTGVPVVAGAGYEYNIGPAADVPDADDQWVFVSGQVTVARSELISQTELNRTNNDQTTLVERAYVAAVDCFTAAILVEVY